MMSINTHQGLYQYTKVPFGIFSAPVLFQKIMDTLLQGVPNTICYLDDILVTGKTDEEHLRNLEVQWNLSKTASLGQKYLAFVQRWPPNSISCISRPQEIC